MFILIIENIYKTTSSTITKAIIITNNISNRVLPNLFKGKISNKKFDYVQ